MLRLQEIRLTYNILDVKLCNTLKNPSSKEYKIAKVDWEDSCLPVSRWQWIEDYDQPEIVRCVSVGFVIANTKKAIALAPNLGDIEREKCQASGIIRIPKSAVKKIRFIL